MTPINSDPEEHEEASYVYMRIMELMPSLEDHLDALDSLTAPEVVEDLIHFICVCHITHCDI
jgi:hypothetical protein